MVVVVFSPVSKSSRLAGFTTNTAPTNIIKSREKIRMTYLTPDPSSSPTNSGRLAPFRRTESIPDR